uniref:Uncharacterized protein n=1 Tax=Orbilia brochopaga TaxID=3140254 RepID=A0A481ZLC8_9PEZI|nr:hypothetical protein [Drechslerella brochopaga]QBL02541.1 hypothetical protein [Drechslerella brochopaga]
MREKEVLIYNYISYNVIFLRLLYVFATMEQRYIYDSEKGILGKDTLFIIDNNIINKYPVLNIYNNLTVDNFIKDNYKYKNDFYWDQIFINTNLIQILKTATEGNLLVTNFEIIGKLLKTFKDWNIKDENNISSIEILNVLTNYNLLKLVEAYKNQTIPLTTYYLKNHKHLHLIKTYNLLPKFIFIVSDLDTFINNIKNHVDVDVNEGPQSNRGKISYLGNRLYRLDEDFRHSMYKHGKYLFNYTNNNKYDLPFGCFTFKNIHINLGAVKW